MLHVPPAVRLCMSLLCQMHSALLAYLLGPYSFKASFQITGAEVHTEIVFLFTLLSYILPLSILLMSLIYYDIFRSIEPLTFHFFDE